jgi:hypothetical protein
MRAIVARFRAMAKDENPRDLMGYEAMSTAALRGVIRAALTRAASPRGLAGEHHFYISFGTLAADVSIPPELQAKYPEEMTIVLQNQFWDLHPGETGFSVTLQFAGQPKSLSIPYAAVTRFVDPAVQFVLQFPPAPAAPTPRPPPAGVAAAQVAPTPETATVGADGPKVVSLDTFRKK